MDREARARLAAIERALRADDPALDAALRAGLPPSRRLGHVKALTVVAAVILVASVVVAYPLGAFLGLIGTGVGIWLWTGARQSPAATDLLGTVGRAQTRRPLP